LTCLSQQTHGFVGADLAALAREAAIRALRRYLPELDLDKAEIDQETLDKLKVFAADFRSAQRDVGPSAMREVMLEVSHVKWETVGGLESAKVEVKEAVEYPLTQRERFENLGIEPPKGVLLYGPPGTGKTLIAKAVASESGANFIPVRGPQLLSKWVGESERAVREIFRKARQVSPSIIFFDEIDALAPARGTSNDSHVIDNVLNQILTEMDGLEELKDVVVMGATNRPDIVDPALLRAGRFDRLVYIGEPTAEDRKKIIGIHTQYMPLEGSAIEEIVNLTEGFTEDMLGGLTEKLGKDKAVTAEEIRAAIRSGKGQGCRYSQRCPAPAYRGHPARQSPHVCRPGPGESRCRSLGHDRGLCGGRSRIALPRGGHARSPRGSVICCRETFHRGAEEGAPHDERQPPGLLRQDPAALQGRSAAESAAAGVPVIFSFLDLLKLFIKSLTEVV